MIPEEFTNYAFDERVKMIRKMLSGNISDEILIGFTRHNPAIITCGSAGINGSIKGVGFIHKEDYLADTLEKIRKELKSEYSMLRAGKFLLEEIYVRDRIDFEKMISLELARKHTWQNLMESKRATILFFTPPSKSYEVRGDVEIHTDDDVWEYTNSLHDIFHRPEKPRDWKKTPAYLFKIREIYDNSEDKMGVRIY